MMSNFLEEMREGNKRYRLHDWPGQLNGMPCRFTATILMPLFEAKRISGYAIVECKDVKEAPDLMVQAHLHFILKGKEEDAPVGLTSWELKDDRCIARFSSA